MLKSIQIADPYFPDNEQEILTRQFREILNGKLSMGKYVEEFENKFASYHQAQFGIAFPSCTSALEAALKVLGVNAGDEILVPVQTFYATGAAVRLAGAKITFVEIEPGTFSIDPIDALSKITPKTKGAIVVHFGGVISPNFPSFVEEMHNRGLFVIEDDAHAHGATIGLRKAGSIGDIGCFSFYPTKIMTTGEGGMAICNNRNIARRLRSIQNRGLDLSAPVESYIELGRNNRFPEISAAMGLSQLRCLDDFLKIRRQVASIYDEIIQTLGIGYSISVKKEGDPSYWRYAVVLNKKIDRERLADDLKNENIMIDWAYFPPLHLQPFFLSDQSTQSGMLPVSEDIMSRHICLPVNSRMSIDDAERVALCLKQHIYKYM
jgi:perosamine synthetase